MSSFRVPSLLFCVLIELLVLGTPAHILAQWQKVTHFPSNLRAIEFIEESQAPRIGIAALFDGELFRTEDSGVTWVPLVSPTTYPISSIALKDTLTFWITTQDLGGLYLTRDGGLTWKLLRPGRIANVYYNPRTHRLFLSDWEKGFFSSDDEGANWNLVDKLAYNGVEIRKDGVGILTGPTGGNDNTILTTSDDGNTWRRLPFGFEVWQPTHDPVTGAFFVASEISPTILRSQDAGAHWTEPASPPAQLGRPFEDDMLNKMGYSTISGGLVSRAGLHPDAYRQR